MKERKNPYTLEDYKADLLELAQEVFITLSYSSPKISFREIIAAGAMLNTTYANLIKNEPDDESDAGSAVRRYAKSFERASAQRSGNTGSADDDDAAEIPDAVTHN
jgi:hypothetical protein